MLFLLASSPDSTGSICSHSGDESSDDEVFSEDSSDSGEDVGGSARRKDVSQPCGKRPLFYVNNDFNDSGEVASSADDLVIFNSNALAACPESTSLLGNSGSNAINNNDVVLTKKTESRKDGEISKTKIEDDLVNRNTLCTGQSFEKIYSDDRVSDIKSDNGQDETRNDNDKKFTSLTDPNTNNSGDNSAPQLELPDDNMPPIVVEMWDETEEVRSPALKSSESIRLPSTSRHAGLFADREEREPTPFFLGGSVKDDQLLGFSNKGFVESSRIEREPTPFFDEKTKEMKSMEVALLVPDATGAKFERELTPFFNQDLTRSDSQGSSQPGHINAAITIQHPVSMNPITPSKKGPISSTPIRPAKDSNMNNTLAILRKEEVNSAENKEKIQLAEVRNCKAQMPHNEGEKTKVDDVIGTKDSQQTRESKPDARDRGCGGRRSRSETKVTKQATVEAPRPRALSVPRDTSPTIAKTEPEEPKRRRVSGKASAASKAEIRAVKEASGSTPTGKVSTATTGTTVSSVGSSGKPVESKTRSVNTLSTPKAVPQISSKAPPSSTMLQKATNGSVSSITNTTSNVTGHAVSYTVSRKARSEPSVLNVKTSATPLSLASTSSATQNLSSTTTGAPQSSISQSTNNGTVNTDKIPTKVKNRKEIANSELVSLTNPNTKRKQNESSSQHDNSSQNSTQLNQEAKEEVTPQKPKLNLTNRIRKTMKGLLPQTNSSTNLLSSSEHSTSNQVLKSNKVKATESCSGSMASSILLSSDIPSETSPVESSSIASTSVPEAPSARPKEKSFFSHLISSFHKTRSRSDKKSKPEKERNKKHFLSNDRRATQSPANTEPSSEDSQSTAQPQDNARSTRPFSEKKLAKYSPFGSRTPEGLCFLLLMTLFCLYMDMPVEKFVCYVLATFYTFCVLRVIGLIE
ncbi:trichohyalin [Biomphalaria glabrata]|nr:trichohyalin-like [Biomphalaria glabrata]